jgi:hypothetical protein
MGALRVVVKPHVRFASARAHAVEVEVEGMLSGAMTRKPHSEVEEFLDEKGREWARRMYEEHLALRAELEQRTAVVGSDGVNVARRVRVRVTWRACWVVWRFRDSRTSPPAARTLIRWTQR